MASRRDDVSPGRQRLTHLTRIDSRSIRQADSFEILSAIGRETLVSVRAMKHVCFLGGVLQADLRLIPLHLLLLSLPFSIERGASLLRRWIVL